MSSTASRMGNTYCPSPTEGGGLKRWMLGTHQGAIGYQHLTDYLNEFVVRLDPAKSASRGKLFFRLAQHALQIAAATRC